MERAEAHAIVHRLAADICEPTKEEAVARLLERVAKAEPEASAALQELGAQAAIRAQQVEIPTRAEAQGRQNPQCGDEAGVGPAPGSGRVGGSRQIRPGRSDGGEAGHLEALGMGRTREGAPR
jgi:hypothetical protein